MFNPGWIYGRTIVWFLQTNRSIRLLLLKSFAGSCHVADLFWNFWDTTRVARGWRQKIGFQQFFALVKSVCCWQQLSSSGFVTLFHLVSDFDVMMRWRNFGNFVLKNPRSCWKNIFALIVEIEQWAFLTIFFVNWCCAGLCQVLFSLLFRLRTPMVGQRWHAVLLHVLHVLVVVVFLLVLLLLLLFLLLLLLLPFLVLLPLLVLFVLFLLLLLLLSLLLLLVFLRFLVVVVWGCLLWLFAVSGLWVVGWWLFVELLFVGCWLCFVFVSW